MWIYVTRGKADFPEIPTQREMIGRIWDASGKKPAPSTHYIVDNEQLGLNGKCSSDGGDIYDWSEETVICMVKKKPRVEIKYNFRKLHNIYQKSLPNHSNAFRMLKDSGVR